MKILSLRFCIALTLIVITFSAPAFLWASGEKSETVKYTSIREVDYAAQYYNEDAGFIAESHLTRTSHLEEGEFTEKSIFQTKVLNTNSDVVNDQNSFAGVLEKYK
jgi:hypothetical protein